LAEFRENKDKVAAELEALDANVNRTRNICMKLDAYQFKYQPVRI
jgi:hypothetical protein